MKIKRIIYFVYPHFCKRDYERGGIEIMKNNKFYIEVWDFTPLICPELYKKVKVPSLANYMKHNYKLFHKKVDSIKEISNLKLDTIVIFMMGITYKNYFLFKELSKMGIMYNLVYTHTIPFYKNTILGSKWFDKYNIAYFIKRIKGLNLEKLKEQIFIRIPHQWLMIQFPKFIFAGGLRSVLNNRILAGLETKIIWGHAMDYDLYLKDLQKPFKNELKGEKYVLFIDGYSPFHPDYIQMKVKPPTTPEKYYPTICKFFNRVEKETGFNVIVAAHPRSKYSEHPDYFEGRRVIHGKTMKLVRDSEFVLLHYSTSLNFAVLFNKPVIFFTTDELEKSRVDKECIRAYSFELNKGFINISSDYKIDWNKELVIDKKAYRNYKEKYIKRKGTKEELFWQIVADEIKKL